MNKPATRRRSIFYLDSMASEIKYSFIYPCVCHPFVGVTFPFYHNSAQVLNFWNISTSINKILVILQL
ncbi:hypothetical protein BpHYR1_040183 [Brachionus plicatilis]|uniref:Uncharacterized protein n=1 Tax=Brachionus plicatilis TaxID=10195 RepID=A0A3M7QHY6_BRAPC|nr:hypothetical protein BpHYR1_040183 [Brachionus plicatilis]